jgi:hypothetical protein
MAFEWRSSGGLIVDVVVGGSIVARAVVLIFVAFISQRCRNDSKYVDERSSADTTETQDATIGDPLMICDSLTLKATIFGMDTMTAFYQKSGNRIVAGMPLL